MPAVGDVFSGDAYVASMASIDIRPDSGYEAIVHNVYVGENRGIQLRRNYLAVSWMSSEYVGSRLLNISLHVTYSNYVTVNNHEADGTRMAWDGVYTKVP